MRRCIVHFGMNKTGSSSIQESLFRQADRLSGVRYLHTGSANGSEAIATAFSDHPTKYHANRKRGLTSNEVEERGRTIRARLSAALSDVSVTHFLLSAEYISNMSATALVRLVDWLNESVDEIEAVGYIRSPVSFAASAFQQRLKGGLETLRVLDLVPMYRERFEIFDRVLGAERVRFWKFDPSSFPSGCVVRDFCARLGIALPEDGIVRVNESLSHQAVSLLYAYRKHGPGYGVGPTAMPENNRLIAALSELSGSPLRFAPSLIRPILEVRRAQIDWMEQRLGVSLEEKLTEDSDAIADEKDLLRFSPEAIRWLAERSGSQCDAATLANPSPEWVAQAMHDLRLKLALDAVRPRTKANKQKVKAMSMVSDQQTSDAINHDSLKPTLHIHIGNGKTGTSAIQKALAENADFLRERGLLYLGMCFEHLQRKHFPWNVSSGGSRLFDLADAELTEKTSACLEQVLVEIHQASLKHAIWSDERLFVRAASITPAIARLSDRCQVHVIVYLRRQDRWLLSAYRQWGIKHKTYSGRLRSFPEWYEWYTKRIRPNELDYADILRQWHQALPQAHFSVRIYDHCPDVCEDFFTLLDVPYSELPVQVGRFYETPNDWLLSYSALFNNLTPDPVRPTEIEPLLRRSGLSQLKAPAPIRFDLPDESFLRDLLDRCQSGNEQLAALFSTPEYAVTFDDSPPVAPEPMQLAEPAALIAGLLRMVQCLDQDVRELRQQIAQLRRTNLPPSPTPPISAAETNTPSDAQRLRRIRLAIGIRADRPGSGTLAVTETTTLGAGLEVFWIADDSQASLDLPRFPTLVHRLADDAAMGLTITAPRPSWYYGDYAFYTFQREAPGYDYYVLLASATWIKPEFFQRLFMELQQIDVDFIGCRFGPRPPAWHWWQNAHERFAAVYGSLFPLMVVSARAIEHLLSVRLAQARELSVDQPGVFCESFVASALMQAGFQCQDLNTLLPNAWSPATFSANKPIWSGEVAHLLTDQWVMHPVLDGEDYAREAQRWSRRHHDDPDITLGLTRSLFGNPLPAFQSSAVLLP